MWQSFEMHCRTGSAPVQEYTLSAVERFANRCGSDKLLQAVCQPPSLHVVSPAILQLAARRLTFDSVPVSPPPAICRFTNLATRRYRPAGGTKGPCMGLPTERRDQSHVQFSQARHRITPYRHLQFVVDVMAGWRTSSNLDPCQK